MDFIFDFRFLAIIPQPSVYCPLGFLKSSHLFLAALCWLATPPTCKGKAL
jgi:hypothetical protein